MNGTTSGIIALSVVIAGFAFGIWDNCRMHEECARTTRDSCIDEAWYNREGECECNTIDGELEWNIGGGCAGYDD